MLESRLSYGWRDLLSSVDLAPIVIVGTTGKRSRRQPITAALLDE